MTCKHSFDEIELGWANGLCAYCLLYALAEAQEELRIAAGLISTLPQFTDKHPEVALQFIKDAAKEQKK